MTKMVNENTYNTHNLTSSSLLFSLGPSMLISILYVLVEHFIVLFNGITNKPQSLSFLIAYFMHFIVLLYSTLLFLYNIVLISRSHLFPHFLYLFLYLFDI